MGFWFLVSGLLVAGSVYAGDCTGFSNDTSTMIKCRRLNRSDEVIRACRSISVSPSVKGACLDRNSVDYARACKDFSSGFEPKIACLKYARGFDFISACKAFSAGYAPKATCITYASDKVVIEECGKISSWDAKSRCIVENS